MALLTRTRMFLAALLFIAFMVPGKVDAADWREDAGVGVGLTAGNVIFVPLKAILTVVAVPQTALSFIATGGDTEVAKQIFENGTEGPFLITPPLARTGVGERPELNAPGAMARETQK